MLHLLISLLIIIIPSIGLISAFSIAATVPCFLLLIFLILRDKIFINFKYTIIKNVLFPQWKLELLFALWCFITTFYSTPYLNSLKVYVKTFSIGLIGFIVHKNIAKLTINSSILRINFIIGMMTAASIFFIEYVSHGMITRSFRSIFQPKTSDRFFLFVLDHGCSLLSVFSWIVIVILIQYRKYSLALIYYLLIIYLLSISDSLASLLAFIIGGLVFISNRLAITKSLQSIFLKLFTVAMLVGSILMPIISYKIEPYKASNHYDKFLPESAKHRLFIWHFVAKKIIEKPILGRGLSASRYYKIPEKEIITYNKRLWFPLPLHPHNNIIQILFETGLIGFLLFLALVVKYIKQIANLALLKNVTNNILDPNVITYTSISYAIFINYYIIGMIACSIWQTWWVCTAFSTIILLKLLSFEKIFK